MWDGHPGPTNAAKHRIELLNDNVKPIHSAKYYEGPKTVKFEKIEMDETLKQKVIESAQAEWAATVVFKQKQDGKLRLFVDYRRPDALTKRDSYPVPLINECIDSLNKASVFSHLMPTVGTEKW